MPLVEHIRDAGPDDVRALCDLQLRAAWDEDLPNLTAHPDAVEVPPDAIADGRVRVAVGGGIRLGYAVVLPVRDGACELDDLFVERAFMHRGIGRLLVDDALRWARERGASCMEVTA